MRLSHRSYPIPTCEAEFEIERLRRLNCGLRGYVKKPLGKEGELMYDQELRRFITQHHIPAKFVKTLQERTRLALALQREILTIKPLNKVVFLPNGSKRFVGRHVSLFNYNKPFTRSVC